MPKGGRGKSRAALRLSSVILRPMTSQLHEDLSRELDEPGGSDKSFGLVFAGVFTAIAVLPLLHGHPLRAWALGPAVAFLVLAFAAPKVLAPLNRVWMAFGRLLDRIVSPIVMAVLFVVAVVPTGIVLRVMGRDPLRLKFDRSATTYWQRREDASKSFADQF